MRRGAGSRVILMNPYRRSRLCCTLYSGCHARMSRISRTTAANSFGVWSQLTSVASATIRAALPVSSRKYERSRDLRRTDFPT